MADEIIKSGGGGSSLTASAGAAGLASKSPFGHLHTPEDVMGLRSAVMDVLQSDIARVTLIGEALASNYTSGGTNLQTIRWRSGGASWDIEAPWASVDEDGNLVVTASGIYELEYADEASIDDEVVIQQLRENYSVGFEIEAGNQRCNPKGVKDEGQSLVFRYPPQPVIERMEGSDAAALIVAGSKVKGCFTPLSTFVGYGRSGRIVSSRTVTIRRIH